MLSASPSVTAGPHADLLASAAEAELARALVTGDESRAILAAETLWRSAGTPEAVYRVVSEQLAAAGEGWVAGFTSLAVAQRLTSAAQRLIARLRPLPEQARQLGSVLLASPPGDGHTLGLHAFAHLVEDRGYRAVVADSLPWDDLAELAAEEEDLVAICLSMHTDVGTATVRRGLSTVHQAAGAIPVVVGGPRAEADPTLGRRVGADTTAITATAGLQQLSGFGRHLTEREREVLDCIAQGMTNNEAGDALGLGAATVKSHLDRIFLKTGTTQRAAAVATALRNGWLR